MTKAEIGTKAAIESVRWNATNQRGVPEIREEFIRHSGQAGDASASRNPDTSGRQGANDLFNEL